MRITCGNNNKQISIQSADSESLTNSPKSVWSNFRIKLNSGDIFWHRNKSLRLTWLGTHWMRSKVYFATSRDIFIFRIVFFVSVSVSFLPVFSLQCPWHRFTCSTLTRFAERNMYSFFGWNFIIILFWNWQNCRRFRWRKFNIFGVLNMQNVSDMIHTA